jgi:hypothetical protein
VQTSRPDAFIVTIQTQKTPTEELTIRDVIVGSLGVAGTLFVIAIALGAVLSLLLLAWRRRFPLERNHLPPVSPLIPDPTARPTSQAQ